MTGMPSGNQWELRRGEQVVEIAEVGAGLRSYTAGSRRVIDGYPVSQMCTGARGHSLIPWPNRIKSGKYTWDGVDRQLDLTEPATCGAIHGLTRWASWQVVEHGDDHASFRHILYNCPGWSWVLDCRIDYSLNDTGLTVRTTATNIGEGTCPYGTGAHPYLTVGTETINPALATVPGDIYLPVDDKGIPTGRQTVEGTEYDLRSASELGTREIDVTYTNLTRDADGRARVRLSTREGVSVALWVDDAYPYLEIFTGDALPEPGRRRTGLGVEPMTCAPNAFNSGEGLITLKPGQSHSATWGIEPYA
ncbi:aldose 1-epimerase family protein [Homoserinimonas sp. OAct 916]|uniref:aldose 1-epimerase family protein n=1 Tax=Homoserinimonas sp. OAct 916 TaxID=2211450 RepID=UPI000DBE85E8|nr:aldose 1-epimerase family protein [Homoserinimonas sp. OAct 916]